MATVRELLTRWDFTSDTRDVDKATSKIGRLSGVAKKLGKGLGIAAGAAAFAAKKIWDYTRGVIDALDANAKLAARTGVTVDTIQQLAHAANLSGGDVNTLKEGINTLATQVDAAATGNKESAKTFRQLGVSIKDAKGKVKPMNDLLLESLAALSDMPNGAKKVALGNKLLGGSFSSLSVMLQSGSVGLAKMMDEARKLGGLSGGKAAKKAEAFNDSMARLMLTIKGVAQSVAVDLIPILKGAVESVQKWVAANRKFISQKLHKMLMAVVSAVKQLVKQAGGAKGIFSGVTRVLTGLMSAMSWVAKNAGLIKAALIALIALSIGSKLLSVASSLSGVVGGLGAAAKGAGVLGAAFAGWEIGKWIDKATGASDKLYKAAWKFGEASKIVRKASEVKQNLDEELTKRKALLKQAQMYAALIKRGVKSVQIEGGKRMALSRENITSRLQRQAQRSGIAKSDPDFVKGAISAAGIKQTNNNTIHVTVPPGTDATTAQRTADAVAKAIPTAVRRALPGAR